MQRGKYLLHRLKFRKEEMRKVAILFITGQFFLFRQLKARSKNAGPFTINL